MHFSCQGSSILCFPILSLLRAHRRGQLQHPLFTDVAGTSFSLIHGPISQMRKPGLREATARNQGGADQDGHGTRLSDPGSVGPQLLCLQGATSSSATRDSPEGPPPRSGSHSPSPLAQGALRLGLGPAPRGTPCLLGVLVGGGVRGQAPKLWVHHLRASQDV